jgi:hypothetical protein
MIMMGDNMTHHNFLGIPVTGDINHSKKRVPQKPLEELAPLMQALLDDETIASFGWTQYTPYFNDGDPCVFSIHQCLVVKLAPVPLEQASYDDHGALISRSTMDDDDDGDDDDGVEYNSALGTRTRTWDERRAGTHGSYTGPDEARYDRCLALEKAISSGAFNDVLLDHFGDHATVRISRNGVKVEEISHD